MLDQNGLFCVLDAASLVVLSGPEPLPLEFRGEITREALADLSWVDPSRGWAGKVIWTAVDASPPLASLIQRYDRDAITLAVNADRREVAYAYAVVAQPAEVIAANEAALEKAYTDAIQKMLDEKADERRYDSIHTAATYVNSKKPKYRDEAQALVDWRDNVWDYCIAELEKIKNGTRTVIPTVEELLAEVNDAYPFAWPDLV